MLFVDQEHTENSWSGLRFGPYQILETLQRGGMGEVLLADKSEPNGTTSKVVLKRLLSELLEDDKYVRMFRAEVGVMSRLDHPNIVKVIDLPMIDGNECLAMEYVQGANVHQLLKRCRKLDMKMPVQLAIFVISEVLEGLEYAHNFMLDDGCSLELVHRDITPGNVLISFHGDVKITDFGIAKSRMSDLSTTVGCVKGTTRYLSPEQIRGEVATPRSDLFSTATVLVEMLSGKPLFDRATVPPTLFAILNGERPPIANLLPFAAPRLSAVLERALSTNADLRFPNARVLKRELMTSAAELGLPAERAAMAAFLREIFPTQSAAQTYDYNLDLTYLVEVPEVAALQEVSTPQMIDFENMIPGAQPLDAHEFGTVVPLVPEPTVAEVHTAETIAHQAGPRHSIGTSLFAFVLAVGAALLFFFHRETPSSSEPEVAKLAPIVIEAPVETEEHFLPELASPPELVSPPSIMLLEEPPPPPPIILPGEKAAIFAEQERTALLAAQEKPVVAPVQKIKSPSPKRATSARASRRKQRAHRGR